MNEPTDSPLLKGALLEASPSRRTELVLEAARALGFAHVGICPAEPIDRRAELEAWIGEGKHGAMDYLADRIEQMLDPDSVLEGARSVIVADRYANGTDAAPEAGPRGRIARYARGRTTTMSCVADCDGWPRRSRARRPVTRPGGSSTPHH